MRQTGSQQPIERRTYKEEKTKGNPWNISESKSKRDPYNRNRTKALCLAETHKFAEAPE